MRLSGYQRSSATRFDSQMTPMIDVVFQLLIFFVCTVSFQKQEQSLPATPRMSASAGGGKVADRPPPELEDLQQVELSLSRRGGATEWNVNKDVCRTLAEVRARLAALARIAQYKTIVPVVLDAADDVPLADAIDAYDLCLRLGFQKVQFVTPE
ncbi:MAG: biopolymer transporter ExbD [Planctomycetia bacterium]|nr:biopolymer transporter ExbD [Planctomycetia bacterium]